jgi:hypothetical protein
MANSDTELGLCYDLKIVEKSILIVGFWAFYSGGYGTFWDTEPCCPLKFNPRFGGTRRFHLHGHETNVKGGDKSKVL